MKKSIIILSVLFSLPFVACDDDNNDFPYNPNYEICGVSNPVENLEWLKEKLIIELYAKEFQGQDYLLIFNSVSSSFLYDIYDCQGNELDVDSNMYKELLNSFHEKEKGWVCIYKYAMDNN